MTGIISIEDFIANDRKLEVLVHPDLEPYSYFVEGKPKGIMVDLLSGVAAKVGLPYETVELPDDQAYYEWLQSGKADIIFDAEFGYDTAEKYGYYLTNSYYSMLYARITRKNNHTGNNVAAVNDSDKVFMEQYAAMYPEKEIVPYDTTDEGMKAVKNGTAECAYARTFTASQYVGADYTNSFIYEIAKDISHPVRVAVKSDSSRIMYSLINKAVGNISEDELQAAINANTQYAEPENGILYIIYKEPITAIVIVTAVMAAIILLVLWFRAREKNTELRHRESDARQKEALKDAYEAAERANRAKTVFLSGMSHDIRTPLNAIIGMTALASVHKDEPDRVSDCLAKITAASRHLLGLINEVLDMSRIESGKVTLSEEEFNLSDLLDNLLELAVPGIKERRHELIVRVHNIKHEDVIGDSLRIQQVFLNIVGNATKYTPDGGKIEIEVSEVAATSEKTGAYKFVFRDNGIGMNPEYVKTIFEPFTREKDRRIDRIQGTGLGMAITKNIVQMMDGSIEVESEQGKGTTFTVIIRLKLQDKELQNTTDFLGLPVLVVDDDGSICENTCHILDEIRMKSEYVLSGREAVDKVTASHARKDDYYAVILDWKMPGMDGLETTKAIREAVGYEVPIIILSAYDWSDIEAEAKAAGVDAFVTKPLFKSKLLYTFEGIENKGKHTKHDGNTMETLAQMDLSSKRLLLVEDNLLNREIACEILSMTKVQIDTAENGEIAVQKFADAGYFYYDLILMDVQMPVMNGYDATITIRAMDRPDAKSIPIIAMAANAFAEDVEKAMASQMNEHLAKPFEIHKIEEILNRWI